ncbi:MAG: DUF1653 domain-containing protein [Lachnospiraceae bacterium]|nr:DUF1653 domain-containing protein [Lachnospiraceae bacterium]
MSNIPKPNEIYKHFKGNLYKIITMALDSETGADVVVYQALYGDYKVYVRELDMFMSKVDREKYPLVTQEYRFELQTGIIGQPVVVEQKVQEERVQEQSQQIESIMGQDSVDTIEVSANTTSEAESELETESLEDILDSMLIEFLEADTYEAKLNILVGLHHKVTDDMINTMAASLDVEVNEEELENRYEELKACLLTFEKYECNRLR